MIIERAAGLEQTITMTDHGHHFRCRPALYRADPLDPETKTKTTLVSRPNASSQALPPPNPGALTAASMCFLFGFADSALSTPQTPIPPKPR
jgi:hypothetical protein